MERIFIDIISQVQEEVNNISLQEAGEMVYYSYKDVNIITATEFLGF